MKRRVEVRVVPRASREEVIEREEGGPLVVKVREPAESGKANKALLKVLARHFNAGAHRRRCEKQA